MSRPIAGVPGPERWDIRDRGTHEARDPPMYTAAPSPWLFLLAPACTR